MRSLPRPGNDLPADTVNLRRRRVLGAATGAAALPWLLPRPALAADWPSRPIRIIAAQARARPTIAPRAPLRSSFPAS